MSATSGPLWAAVWSVEGWGYPKRTTYCKECTQLEKDRDECPKIVNLGTARTNPLHELKKSGFKER